MRELKFQFSGALLMVLTVAAAISAFINFEQQSKFKLPDDGVTWSDAKSGVHALFVAWGSPAEHAGIRRGDVLLKVAGAPVESAIDVSQVLVRVGAWNKAPYTIRRHNVDFETTVVVGQAMPD